MALQRRARPTVANPAAEQISRKRIKRHHRDGDAEPVAAKPVSEFRGKTWCRNSTANTLSHLTRGKTYVELNGKTLCRVTSSKPRSARDRGFRRLSPATTTVHRFGAPPFIEQADDDGIGRGRLFLGRRGFQHGEIAQAG